MGRVPHAGCAAGILGGASYGATKRVRGVPKLGAYRMLAAPLGAMVEPPYGATKRARGVPKLG
eukprot:431272-Pyramimonas_sp.AAC.1